MKTKTQAKLDPIQSTTDFQELVKLLSVFTEASNRLGQLQVDANNQLMDVLDEILADYTQSQQAATEAEAAMEHIANRHPEWFSEKRSIKTPWGVVKFHRSNPLVVPNEEATIARLELMEERSKKTGVAEEHFVASAFIREKRELDLEALDRLDDATLAQLGLKRVQKDNFSVKPATLDLGKAVKESQQEPQSSEAA